MSNPIEVFKSVLPPSDLAQIDPTTLEYIEGILGDRDSKEDDLLDSLVPLVAGSIGQEDDYVTKYLKEVFAKLNTKGNEFLDISIVKPKIYFTFDHV